MQTTTANYDTAIKAVTREIRAYLKFNGSTIVRGVDGLISIKWNQELSDTERFSIGQAVSSYIDTELYSTAVSGVTLETSYIDAYIGVVLSYANSMPVGSIENDYAVVEYVPLGRFYVNTVEKAKNTVRITAYDAMSKLAGDYTTTVTPGGSGYAITDIANDVLTQCGISGSVSGSHGYTTAISPGTCREQLGWCCSMIYSNGSSYIINRANNTLTNTTVIGQSAGQYTITDAVIYLDGADIQPSFTITSVEATAGENTYSYGTGAGVVTSNPYITTAQTQAIYNSLKNFTYTPMKIEFRGDPKIDVGDVITVTTGGSSYTCVVMRLLNTFNGGLKTTIYCYGNSEEYYEMSQSPTGARIIQTQDMVRIEVQRATDAEGALQSSITTNANNITLAVANTPVVNLLPSVYYRENASGATYEANGITWTLNNDGSITATGTASSDSYYFLALYNTTASVPVIPIDSTKKYTLSGCPSGGASTSKYNAQMRLTPPGVTPSNTSGTVYKDTGSGITSATGFAYACVYLVVYSGYAIPTGGITFNPMLEVGDTAHSYVSTHIGTDALTSRMTSAESAIIQNANDITLKVSTSDFTGNNIIGQINLNSTTATIAASHINLQGAVTISDLNSTAKSTLQTGTAVKNQYYISTSSSSATGGSWADTTSAWSSGKYVWTRVVTTKTYADGNSTTTNGTAVYDANLTSALETGAANTANMPVVNLLPSVYYREFASGNPYSTNGLTFTVNADGSITVSGTASAQTDYYLTRTSMADVPRIAIDQTKKYTVSGTPDVSGCAMRWAVYNQSGTATATYQIDTTGNNGTSRVIPAGSYTIVPYIRIASGTAITSGVTFYPMLEAGDTVHGYVSSRNGSSAILSSAVTSTVSCYYRSTTSTTPTISTSTSIGTSASTSNAWEYVMPQPKNGCYFFTCERYTHADGSVAFSTVREIANATYTSLWCSSADATYIDGGHIYANSVTADKIAANETFTQKLYAQDFNITGGSIHITTSSDSTDSIWLNGPNNTAIMQPQGVYVLNLDGNGDTTDRATINGAAIRVKSVTNGTEYDRAILAKTGINLYNSAGTQVYVMNSSTSAEYIGTEGQGGTIHIRSGIGANDGILLEGGLSSITVGASGGAGAIYVRDSSGYNHITLAGSTGNITLTNGTQSIEIKPGTYTMWLNGTSKYSALIWPDGNGAGRFVLGDGASTLWRTQLDNTGLTFRDGNDAVTATYPATWYGLGSLTNCISADKASAGSYTHTLDNGLYLVATAKYNTNLTSQDGLWIVSIHGSGTSHVTPVLAASGSTTVSASGSTLTVTTGLNYVRYSVLLLASGSNV